MSDISPGAVVASGTKTLWAAVGVLGAAVVGLGGTLYYTQSQKSPDAAVPVATVAVPAAMPEPAARQPVAEKAAPAPVPRPVATKTAKPAPAVAPLEAKAVPVKPVCANCATVTAVTPVEREGQGSGTGAVAGGVLGAIVGNQVGQGQGKDLATIIGAIGGGIAGNQVEKKMKKVTVYQVDLRLDDGGRRTLELPAPIGVGERVRLDGDTLQPLPAGY